MKRTRSILFLILTVILQCVFSVNLTFATPSYNPELRLNTDEINMKISLWDSDETQLDTSLNDIPWDEDLTLKCEFSISPDSLRTKYKDITSSSYGSTTDSGIQAFFYEINFPEQVYLPNNDTDLTFEDDSRITIGNCYTSHSSHKILLAFNKEILNPCWTENIKVNIKISGHFDKNAVESAGGGTQDLAFKDDTKAIETITVNFISAEDKKYDLAGNASLSKSGKVITEGSNKDKIMWTLRVDPTTKTFSQGILIDEILGKTNNNGEDFGGEVNGLTFEKDSLVMKNNNKTFTEKIDYSLDYSNGKLTLNLPTIKKANGPLVITYLTSVDSRALYDLNNVFYNTSDFYAVDYDNLLKEDVKAYTSIKVDWISKDVSNPVVSGTNITVEWTITANSQHKYIENAYVSDTLQKYLSYIDGSATIQEIKTDGSTGDISSVSPEITSVAHPSDSNIKIESLKFNLGNTDSTYIIKFKTSVSSKANQTRIENTPVLGIGDKTITGKVCSLNTIASSIRKDGIWSAKDHMITWTLWVNEAGYTLPAGTMINDFLPLGLTLVDTPPTIEAENDSPAFSKPTVTNTKTGAKIKFIADKEFSEPYKITFKTTVDDINIWGNNTTSTFRNEGELKYADSNNTILFRTGCLKSLDTPSSVVKKEAGKFDYSTKRIAWTVTINENQMSIPHAQFIDTIDSRLTYELASFKLIKNDGTPVPITVTPQYSKTNPSVITGVTYDLGDIAEGDYYTITYTTLVDSKLFMKSGDYSIPNNAYIKGDTIAQVTDLPFDLGKGVLSQGVADIHYESIKKVSDYEGGNYAFWSIYINPLNAPLGNGSITITDKLPAELKLDLPSIKLYKLKVDKDFNLSTDFDQEITTLDSSNISYDKATNTLSYTLPPTIDNGTESYVLEFGTDVINAANHKTILNSATFDIQEEDASTQTTKVPAQFNFEISSTAADISAKRGASLKVTKIDSTNPNKKLSGAVLECYYEWNGERILKSTATTNSNGIADFYGLTLNTTYYIVEKEAPAGYLLSTQELVVTPTVKGSILKEEFKNTPSDKGGRATLIKKDAVSNEPLKDAVYSLYNIDGLSPLFIGDHTTDSSGVITTAMLHPGKYRWVEKTAPTGYSLNTTPIDFEFTNSHLTDTQVAYDTPLSGSLLITKVDADNKSELLSGVQFTLYKGNDLYNVYTTVNGKIDITGLPLGKYEFVETKALSNYIPNTQKYSFEINLDNFSTPREFIIENTKLNSQPSNPGSESSTEPSPSPSIKPTPSPSSKPSSSPSSESSPSPSSEPSSSPSSESSPSPSSEPSTARHKKGKKVTPITLNDEIHYSSNNDHTNTPQDTEYQLTEFNSNSLDTNSMNNNTLVSDIQISTNNFNSTNDMSISNSDVSSDTSYPDTLPKTGSMLDTPRLFELGLLFILTGGLLRLPKNKNKLK